MGMYATRRGVQGLRQQSVMSTPNRAALWIQGVMTTFSRATPSSVRSTALGLRHVELLARAKLAVMKAIESNMPQPAAEPMRLILIKFSTGVGRRVSKSSNFAHRGSMVIRTIC